MNNSILSDHFKTKYLLKNIRSAKGSWVWNGEISSN
jgi:hypothetical protein